MSAMDELRHINRLRELVEKSEDAARLLGQSNYPTDAERSCLLIDRVYAIKWLCKKAGVSLAETTGQDVGA